MFFKRYVITSAILFFMCLQFIVAQQPQIVIDQLVEGNDSLSYTIIYTVFDEEADTLNHSITAFSINNENQKIPFSTTNFNTKIETGTLYETEILFSAESLEKYNTSLQDIGYKIIAYKDVADDVGIQTAVNSVKEAMLQQYMAEVEGVRNFNTNPDHYFKTQKLFDSLALQAAHYDTVADSPGADDNGSGVCGLLMAMEVLKNYDFEKNIKIVSFDDEEIGLVGSEDYIINGIGKEEKLKGVFNFEMIGYASSEPNTQELPLGFNLLFPGAANFVEENEFRGDFLICVGNDASVDLITAFQNAASQYVPGFSIVTLQTPGNGEITQDLRRSDHASFWDNGYQALMITDGANFRNPNYHTPNDKSELLDFEFMANTVKATIAAVMQTAKPIIYNEATAFIKDAQMVNMPGIDNAGFNIEFYNFNKESSIVYQLPAGLSSAIMKIYNINGQFLQANKLNSPNGRLNLKSNYNQNQFAFVIIQTEGNIRYAKKIAFFP